MQASDAIRAIKERINIVDLVRRYVDLRQNGSRYVAPCPFHQETKPSFSVNPEKGFFYCFGCHASGDIFEFYCKINGMGFGESLEQLAAEAGINLHDEKWKNNNGNSEKDRKADSSKKSIFMMHEIAAAHFQKCRKKNSGSECNEYIRKRGISSEIQEKFGIGWAERSWNSLADELRQKRCDLNLACVAGLLAKSSSGTLYDRFRGRLIFPICDLSGRMIAFGGRIIADSNEAKYINSPDTPIYKKKEHLFGLAQARRSITSKGCALLTEGYMDVLTLHQYGHDNGVGVLGTALTDEQIKRLSGFTSRVLLIFDGDAAGRKAALRSCEMFLCRGLHCNVVLMPEGEDIDSFLRSMGSDAFARLCETAPEGLKYCADALKAMSPRDAVAWAKKFVGDVQIPELASPYASALAPYLGIDEKILREEVATSKSHSAPFTKNCAVTAPDLQDVRDTQIVILAVRYPEKLNDLRDIGADLAIRSEQARDFWHKLENFGPHEVYYHLDDAQKNFWHIHRGPTSAPLNSWEEELACLQRYLSTFYMATQKSSITAALAENRANCDFAADLEYLRALQETIGNNGIHGDNHE